jgi:Protein of unknown function (DUF1003)
LLSLFSGISDYTTFLWQVKHKAFATINNNLCTSNRTVLMGWVGVNLAPGLPHWDESPFILLNLVFSFASAYTATYI